MESSDGQHRFASAGISGSRLTVRARAARVELGHTDGDQVRVRWTVPHRLGRPGAPPRFTSGRDGLLIRCPRARLRIDLPAGMVVRVRLRRGQITSWGASGELDLETKDGSVACRELLASRVLLRARQVNLHFAAAPQLVDATCQQAVIALPGGPYLVTVPEGAEVTVPRASAESAGFAGSITVRRATDVRVLAAGSPLELNQPMPGS